MLKDNSKRFLLILNLWLYTDQSKKELILTILRYLPGRVLCYLKVFKDITQSIISYERRKSRSSNASKPDADLIFKVTCLGAGNGAELCGLAAVWKDVFEDRKGEIIVHDWARYGFVTGLEKELKDRWVGLV